MGLHVFAVRSCLHLLLESTNVRIQLGDVLFDDLSQLLDLCGAVPKQATTSCHCTERHREAQCRISHNFVCKPRPSVHVHKPYNVMGMSFTTSLHQEKGFTS